MQMEWAPIVIHSNLVHATNQNGKIDLSFQLYKNKKWFFFSNCSRQQWVRLLFSMIASMNLSIIENEEIRRNVGNVSMEWNFMKWAQGIRSNEKRVEHERNWNMCLALARKKSSLESRLFQHIAKSRSNANLSPLCWISPYYHFFFNVFFSLSGVPGISFCYGWIEHLNIVKGRSYSLSFYAQPGRPRGCRTHLRKMGRQFFLSSSDGI